MNKDAAVKIIENIVAFSKYESSNDAHEIAEFCQMVSMGKDEDEEVKELRPHETQAQKDQRARQYHSLSQYASNKILNYVRRLKSVEDATVSYQDISDEQAQKLKAAVKDFYDEKDLLEYIIEQYANSQGKDPNALLLLASEDIYDNTGALIDRKAIPKIIPSEKIIQVIENQGVISVITTITQFARLHTLPAHTLPFFHLLALLSEKRITHTHTHTHTPHYSLSLKCVCVFM